MQKRRRDILLIALLCVATVCAAEKPSAPSAEPAKTAINGATPPESSSAAAIDVDALPAGARFSVSATPWHLTGGIDSGSDKFKFLLEGDTAAIAKISRIDYAVDTLGTGDPRRNFFLDGAVERSRWPIVAKITWRNGKVTHAKLDRP